MNNNRDFSGLSWVKGEIEETLDQARNALESYVETPSDITQLRFCASYLHQVRGTLKILELYGAELLAEEMEKVVQALLDEKISQRDDAYAVLLGAILRMPGYLERISSGHTDVPIILLPLLNDLRASRSQSLLSSNSLFSPDLSTAAPSRPEKEEKQQSETALRKLRHQFQANLVIWYRNPTQHKPLRQMAEVLDKIEAHQPDNAQVWWVARGLFETITLGGTELSTAIKMLIGQIDREIKQLIDQKEDYSPKHAAQLTKNMLFYIGHSDQESVLVNEIQKTFNLAQLLPSKEQLDDGSSGELGGLDSNLLDTVSQALKEELLKIKDTLDLFVRNPDKAELNIEEMRENLRQVGDTLGMLGQGVLRNRIIEQSEYIDSLIDESGQLNDSHLMKVASALLSVESSLSSLADHSKLDTREQSDIKGVDQDPEYHQLMMDVVREALQEIAQVKERVIQFAKTRENSFLLTEVPSLLSRIKGGLLMLGIEQPSILLEKISQLISQHLLGKQDAVNQHNINLLADTITGIEYYLEALIEHRSDRPEILSFAQHSLDALQRDIKPEKQLATPEPEPQAVPYVKDDELDEIQEVFLEEAEEELESITIQLARWQQSHDDQAALSTLRRSFHTLKGSGRLVGADEIAELAWSIESLLNKVIAETLKPCSEIFAILQKTVQILPALIISLRTQTPHTADVDTLSQQADALASDDIDTTPSTATVAPVSSEARIDSATETEPPDTENQADTSIDDSDDEIIEIFIEEANEQLKIISQQLALYSSNPNNQVALEEIRRAFHTLKGSGRMVDAMEIGDFAWSVEKELNEKIEGKVDDSEVLVALISRAEELIPSLITAFSEGESRATEVAAFIEQAQKMVSEESAVAEPEPREITPDKETEEPTSTPAEFDEVTEIFLEEAVELLGRIDATLHENLNNRESGDWIAELHRDLHTLKGSARMANVSSVGDLGHELESLLELLNEQQKGIPKSLMLFLQQGHDQLLSMIETVQQHRTPVAADTLLAQIEEWIANPELLYATDDDKAETTDESNNTTHEPVWVEAKQSAGELVRLRSELLDTLVNDSAELGVFRSRISQKLNSASYNLNELQQTIIRVNHQVRSLEIEAETHMQHRSVEIDPSHYDDFDSLELDRFSTIHQLARSLTEGMSDLESLHKLLQNQVRDTEVLFEQQQRRHSELHDNLMHTRLVPFSSITPRLRRIIRQTSEALGKQVSLQIINEHIELDRAILNRLLPVFEHLLRNAVDHGIESPQQRQKNKKPKNGTITITLEQMANQIGVQLSDDGAGLDRDKITHKAISLEMLDLQDSQQLSDVDIYQYILEPGFTTASEVTQISGRGVGLDVVNTEIKQLGGSLQLRSTPQQGITFSMVLPLTLAIQHVLMAKVADCTYGLPLNGFLGLARMSGDKYLTQLEAEQPTLHHDGVDYQLLSLEEVMGHKRAKKLRAKQAYLLLYRLNDHNLALHADRLQGHHEIVMKPLGPQASALPSVAGGTIMADGNVVLIIDLAAALRAHLTHQGKKQALQPLAEQNKEVKPKLSVMIVDDSLTVRKVSSRFIERNGMLASTANDGFDALEKVQEIRPDIILLDIEMPRMDGFEFATHLRSDEKLKETPIIMITSRTGEKHRERAARIGVNRYLGKPYNEQELLESIAKLTGWEIGSHHE